MKCKKTFVTGLLSVIFSGVLSTGTLAAGTTLEINGDPYTGAFFISENRIYVPLRAVCEDLGYTVTWDSDARTAIVSSDSVRAAFPCNGESIARDSTLYTPVRVIAEALNGSADWNGDTSTATLDLLTVQNEESDSNDLHASDENAASAYTDDELYWLARIVYAEARGESMEGKIAVANTILERVASDEFPDTIYGVIFDDQYCIQYEPVANGTIYNTPDEDSYEAAKRALNGETAVEGCLYFFNPDKATSNWIAENRTYVTTIGNHVFYA